MNHKIVKTPNTEILVYRDLTDEGDDVVVVQGWKPYNDDPDSEEGLIFESHDFANSDAAKAFVRDFSEVSAEEFYFRNQL